MSRRRFRIELAGGLAVALCAALLAVLDDHRAGAAFALLASANVASTIWRFRRMRRETVQPEPSPRSGAVRAAVLGLAIAAGGVLMMMFADRLTGGIFIILGSTLAFIGLKDLYGESRRTRHG